MGLYESAGVMPLLPGTPTIKTVGTGVATLDLSALVGKFVTLQVKGGRIYMRAGASTAAITVTTNSFFMAVDGSAPTTRDALVLRDQQVMKLKADGATRMLIVTPTS